mmetsp:Transcript_16467/g.36984  ORF Transcript_16467/g.36984 Transcript_16467/m.36984 type:complete len:521 (-) Transcript_16467:286-1848(-)
MIKILRSSGKRKSWHYWLYRCTLIIRNVLKRSNALLTLFAQSDVPVQNQLRYHRQNLEIRHARGRTLSGPLRERLLIHLMVQNLSQRPLPPFDGVVHPPLRPEPLGLRHELRIPPHRIAVQEDGGVLRNGLAVDFQSGGFVFLDDVDGYGGGAPVALAQDRVEVGQSPDLLIHLGDQRFGAPVSHRRGQFLSEGSLRGGGEGQVEDQPVDQGRGGVQRGGEDEETHFGQFFAGDGVPFRLPSEGVGEVGPALKVSFQAVFRGAVHEGVAFLHGDLAGIFPSVRKGVVHFGPDAHRAPKKFPGIGHHRKQIFRRVQGVVAKHPISLRSFRPGIRHPAEFPEHHRREHVERSPGTENMKPSGFRVRRRPLAGVFRGADHTGQIPFGDARRQQIGLQKGAHALPFGPVAPEAVVFSGGVAAAQVGAHVFQPALRRPLVLDRAGGVGSFVVEDFEHFRRIGHDVHRALRAAAQPGHSLSRNGGRGGEAARQNEGSPSKHKINDARWCKNLRTFLSGISISRTPS